MASPSSSRAERIENLAREVHPHAELDPEAAALLDQLTSLFLRQALEEGKARAQGENNEIHVAHLREYVQGTLDLDVLGFAQDELMEKEAATSLLREPNLWGSRKEETKKHQERVAERKQAVDADILREEAAKTTKVKRKKLNKE